MSLLRASGVCRKMTIEFRKLGLDRRRALRANSDAGSCRDGSHVWNKAPRREEENEDSTIDIQNHCVAGPALCRWPSSKHRNRGLLTTETNCGGLLRASPPDGRQHA